jgi:hypothetical protein
MSLEPIAFISLLIHGENMKFKESDDNNESTKVVKPDMI